MTSQHVGRLLCSGLFASLIAAGGCGSSFDSFGGPAGGLGASGGEFGATTGGVKDLNQARELVKNGLVPPAAAILVEAAFAEHDLPLTGPPCATTLCLRGALGVAPTLAGEPAGWVQIGLSSTIDPATYQRPSLSAIFTVDVSGSMGWEAKNGSYPSPGNLADHILREIAARLGPNDHAAVVTYGSSASVVLDVTAGDDPRVIETINGLHTNGSTNMEAGLRVAYSVAARERQSGRQVRLFLFTDEQPNVGATTATEFQRLVQQGADDGAGITIFGLGLGLGSELTEAMSHLRGGNAFSLSKLEQVAPLFEQSWPWLASPIAYALKAQLLPSVGYAVADTYGFPGTNHAPMLDVSTVFLSRNKGALLAQVRPSSASAANDFRVSGSLSYENPSGSPYAQTLEVAYNNQPLDARGMYFEQPAVGSTVALAILMSSLHQAASMYAADRTGAADLAGKAVTRATADRASLGDASLDQDIQFAADLHRLMLSGATQGSLYGQ